MYVYLNGEFLEESQAFIPIHDKGFLFGEGVFTTARVENGVALQLDAHLKRLHIHCKVLNIPIPTIGDDVVDKLIKLNHAFSDVWRLKIVITAPCDGKSGTVLGTIAPYKRINKSFFELVTYPFPLERELAKVKSLSYLDFMMAKQFAQKNQCDDALLKNSQGYILETSQANIVWLLNKTLYTPSSSLSRLSGISLNTFLKAAQRLNYRVEEVKVLNIPQEASVFVTNSMIQFFPVKRIDSVDYFINYCFLKRVTVYYSDII